MYGRVKSSNGIATVDATSKEYSVKFDEPIEVLRIYANNFQSLLYLNDSTDGIYVDSFYGVDMGHYEINEILIHNFTIKPVQLFAQQSFPPYTFMWYGLY